MSATIAPDTGFTHLPIPFPLHRGGAIVPAFSTWELVGPDDAPLVVVLGGISAGRHVSATVADPRPGWWEELVGPGRAIDTTRLRVLGVDWLSGEGGTIGTEDHTRALVGVLDALGVDRAFRIVGASFGGMVGLAFATLFPARVDGLVAISAPHRPHASAVAARSLQREIVRLGLRHGDGARALAIARGLALTTYRTAEALEERFGGGGGADAPVSKWLQEHGEAYARQEDPERWLQLATALDLHRIEPARLTVPTLLIGAPEDRLVPFAQLQELRRGAGGPCGLVYLPSRYGHDAFLKEVTRLEPLLRAATTADTRLDVRLAVGGEA